MDVKGTTTIEQETQEERPKDVAIPMIGGELDWNKMRAHLNALLYMLTEFMAIHLKVLDHLVEKEILTPDECNSKILAVTGNKEQLTAVYNELFARFIGYVNALDQLQKDGHIFKPEGEMENSDGE